MSKALCPVCGNPTYSIRTAITPEKSWSEPGPCSMECVQKLRDGQRMEEAESYRPLRTYDMSAPVEDVLAAKGDGGTEV